MALSIDLRNFGHLEHSHSVLLPLRRTSAQLPHGGLPSIQARKQISCPYLSGAPAFALAGLLVRCRCRGRERRRSRKELLSGQLVRGGWHWRHSPFQTCWHATPCAQTKTCRSASHQDSRMDVLEEKCRLGRWMLKGRMVLAPMEQVTDCAYRRLCSELGASFCWTEMVRAAALIRRNGSTVGRIDTHDAATPTGVQLIVSSPQELRNALQVIDDRAIADKPHWARGIHGIDLNFGCPSPHIINDGLGPAMLSRPYVIREMFDILAEWRSQTKLPIGAIGAKMRLGLNQDEERRGVYLRAIQYAKGRLDYVVLHPRHAREESKKSSARWEHIRRAKEAAGSRLAVIGNGDVFTREDAARMIAETGCDAVMVARGATKTVGKIFDPAWDGEDASVAASADELERRLEALTDKWGGARSKIAEYHQESFRRVRARGSRRKLRLLWEDMKWWLMREHRTMDNPVTEDERAQHIEMFFATDARIQLCNLSPDVNSEYTGPDGILQFLPFLAKVVTENKQDVHLPSEEADKDPQQVIVGLSNTCNVLMLFNDANKIARLNVWCVSCDCHDAPPSCASALAGA
eukprot:TRINITY_DN48556_c0_g1_i1.p1 TRINITY_DN48556_c0_g1~~TRINITY_DN48556_c0_g1_i1.p1  ORF type:complete len:590 (+),score=70.31 TRINITY_DN48556_c0_g1_i1:40-1770(+)